MSLVLPPHILKYRYGGSYEILISKLGQELIDDVDCVGSMCDLLKDHAGRLQTPAGRLLLNRVLDEMQDFKRVPTPQQWHLRDLCRAQNLNAEWTCTPTWANGAVVLSTAADASEIKDTLQEEVLRKGDVIVSSSLAELVRGIIESRHTIPGDSERPYRKQRPALRADARRIERQPLSAVVASNIRGGVGRARSSPPRLGSGDKGTADSSSFVSRCTHTTGSRPSNKHARGRDYGVNRKKFKLAQFAVSESSRHEGAPSAEHTFELPKEDGAFSASASSIAESNVTELSLRTVDVDRTPNVADLIRSFCGEHLPPRPLSEPEFLQSVAERAICLLQIFESVLELPADHEKVTMCYSLERVVRESLVQALTFLHGTLSQRVLKCICKANVAPFVQVEGEFSSKSVKVAAVLPDHLKRAFKKKSRIDVLALPQHVPLTLDFTSAEEMINLVRVKVLDVAKAALSNSIKDVLDNVMTKTEENKSRLNGIEHWLMNVFAALVGSRRWDRETREMFRGQQKINAKLLESKRR
eukprot:TRINITY_DN20919_c0_g1_i1.p1 TRINITY_DN20919_c0_g1~~TRINITY_DN20919_c0_g1_i1.p1  ORF type:complete len:527 (+),score=62.63 TRINITY_DN20919_c0_g1_i1:79-1659(+)